MEFLSDVSISQKGQKSKKINYEANYTIQ